MSLKFAVDKSFDNEIALLLNEMSPEKKSRIAAEFARQEEAAIEQINHAPPIHVYVDGRDRAPLESVKPEGGVIIFEWEFIGAIVVEALKMLRDASPIVTGAYRNAHSLYVNGAAVDDVPESFNPNDQVMVANPLPYARRIEIGVTESGRPFVMQVPNHIYRRIGTQLAQRYADVAKIMIHDKPGIVLNGAYIVKGVAGGSISSHHIGKGGRRLRRRLHRGEDIQSPAIEIAMRA